MAHAFGGRVAALTLVVVALTVAAVAAGAALLVTGTLHDAVARRLEAEARFVAAALPRDPAELRSFVRTLGGRLDERITLVSADGRVLADSQLDVGLLDNHADRPEIVEARTRGVGIARRRSASVGRPLLYVAIRVDHVPAPRAAAATGPSSSPVREHPVAYVRLALPVDRAEAPIGRLRLALGTGLVAGAAAAVAAAVLASRWLRRRAEGLAVAAELASRGRAPAAPRGDELEPVERALADAAAHLGTHLAALAEQRRRVEAIIDSMDEGLIVVTAGGEVLLMNAVAERMLDLPPEAWRGRTLIELTRAPELHALLARAGTERRASGEMRLAPPREAEVAVSVAPLRGEAPAEALGHVVVLRDVTRLKRLERMRTDFVANVSHELKTPLAAIRAALETLHDWALEDPAGARRWVAMSLAHAERLQRLIDDLLVLSDLELRQVRLVKRPVDLASVVDETFGLLAAKAAERGVTLVKSLPPDFPPLVADRNRLIQILVNLVDNAVKFTRPGGTVTVSGETRPDGMRGVVVADTGIGVPKADLPRLGERFYRVEKGRSRDAGGTGLGLAIVKHLVQAHGGRLEISSEVGRGTTVRVLLPPGDAEGSPDRERGQMSVSKGRA